MPGAQGSPAWHRLAPWRDWTGRLWAALLVYGLAYCAWRATAGAPGPAESLANRSAFVAPSLLGTALGWLAARSPRLDRESRRAWRLLAGAFAALAIGDAIWLGEGPAPGLAAHLAWLLYYPLLLLGILGFPRAERTRRERARFWIDAASVVGGGAMLLVYLWFGTPARIAAAGMTTVSLAYPLGDLVLLMGAAVLGLRRWEQAAGPAYVLLTLGLLVEFGGDVAYGSVATAGSSPLNAVSDAAYMLAWLLRGSAAFAFARVAAEPAPRTAGGARTSFSLLPYGFALVGYVTLFLGAPSAGAATLRLLAGGAALLTALALLGQWVTALDNARLQAQHAERRSEARFRSLVQNSSDMIAIVDEHNRFRYVAPSAEGLLGRPADELQGCPLAEIVHPDDLPHARVFLAHAALHLGMSGPAELRIGSRPRWVAMEAIATNLLSDPEIGGIVLTMRNVSERKALEEQLIHRALHDPLTALANRALFADRLGHARQMSLRHGGSYAVVVMDFDDFKAVNDGYGHAAGDQVLIETARRLRAAVRETDTPARLGGDEFAVLLESPDGEGNACRTAEKILAAMAEAFELPARTVHLTACIGIALSARDLSDEEVLRQADLALYCAKEAGKGQFALFAPGMHSEMLRRNRLEGELREAVARGDLHLLYQPVVSLRTGRTVGAEALVRWRHPARGLIPPSEFIDLAEASGLIAPLGRWVIDHACRQAAAWNPGVVERLFYVGVNLSVRQLHEADIVRQVRGALARSGLAAGCLVLEITETLLASDPLAATARLRELKATGVQLALDDFGAGYSSLGRLRGLPIDILKIDGAFCRDLGSPQGRSLARAIIDLGKAIDLRVIGEGVEDPEQALALQRLGCQLAQGFHFGRPLEADELSRRLARAQ